MFLFRETNLRIEFSHSAIDDFFHNLGWLVGIGNLIEESTEQMRDIYKHVHYYSRLRIDTQLNTNIIPATYLTFKNSLLLLNHISWDTS